MTKHIEDKFTAKAVITGKLVEQFLVVKEYFGLENNAEVIRILVREKARNIQKVQLNKDSEIRNKIDELFHQGYFEEFLEDLEEKDSVLFQNYIESRKVKPSEKGEVKA